MNIPTIANMKSSVLLMLCGFCFAGSIGCSNSMEPTGADSEDAPWGKSDRITDQDRPGQTQFVVTPEQDKQGKLYLFGTFWNVIDNLFEQANKNYQARIEDSSDSGAGVVGGEDLRTMYDDVMESSVRGNSYLIETVHSVDTSTGEKLLTATSTEMSGLYKLLELMLIAEDNGNVDGIDLETTEASGVFGPIECTYVDNTPDAVGGNITTCTFSNFDEYTYPDVDTGQPRMTFEFSRDTSFEAELSGVAASQLNSFIAKANQSTAQTRRGSISNQVSCGEDNCTIANLTKIESDLPVNDTIKIRDSRIEDSEPKAVGILFNLLKDLKSKASDTRRVEGESLECFARKDRGDAPNYPWWIQTTCSLDLSSNGS